MPINIQEMVTELNKTNHTHDEYDLFISIPQNDYLSNRHLGGEYCYVLERNNQQRYIGNKNNYYKQIITVFRYFL